MSAMINKILLNLLITFGVVAWNPLLGQSATSDTKVHSAGNPIASNFESQFHSQAERNVRLLGSYIALFASKKDSLNEENYQKQINNALELFDTTVAKVEISFKGNRGNAKQEARDYLNRYGSNIGRRYDKIQIGWPEGKILENASTDPRELSFSILQTFRGLEGEKVKYEDQTRKDIIFEIKSKEVNTIGDHSAPISELKIVYIKADKPK